MEEELCRLRSHTELHRMQTTVIATLEGERAALERDRDTLRSTMDAMRTAQRKVEEYTCTKIHSHTHKHKHTHDGAVTPNMSVTTADVILLEGRWTRVREKEMYELNERQFTWCNIKPQ